MKCRKGDRIRFDGDKWGTVVKGTNNPNGYVLVNGPCAGHYYKYGISASRINEVKIKQGPIKWAVYGESGGYFSNLTDAKACAKEASIYEGHAEVYLLYDGCHYIDYENGKMVRDGWTIKETK